MTNERADMGFGQALGDLEEFAPRPKPSSKVDTEQAARAAGFRSREAGARQARRRRTGRNAQFNLKVKPETIDEFTRIADDNGWGLGETLERAVALLQREHGSGN